MKKDDVMAIIVASMVVITLFIFILTIIGVFGYE